MRRFMCVVAIAAAIFSIGAIDARHPVAAGDAAPSTAEKDAFAAAKELGTADAWEAFLTNYPSGFHADLARAYLKKLGSAEGTPPEPSQTLAEAFTCTEGAELFSKESRTAATVTFVNRTQSTRVVYWIDEQGARHEYARLQPGREHSQPTYLTHPWLIADDDGACVQMFRARPGTTIALLESERGPASPSSAKPTQSQSSRERDKPKARGSRSEKSARTSCIELGMAYRNGRCVATAKKDVQRYNKNKTKACPGGMYRNPLGQCQPNETGG